MVSVISPFQGFLRIDRAEAFVHALFVISYYFSPQQALYPRAYSVDPLFQHLYIRNNSGDDTAADKRYSPREDFFDDDPIKAVTSCHSAAASSTV